MSSKENSRPLSPKEVSELEDTIFAARNYAIPSEDLRPRTIEQAQESDSIKDNARRLGLWAVLGMILWSASLPASQWIDSWRTELIAPFPSEIHQDADRMVVRRGISPHWALVEIFSHLRGRNSRSSKPNQAE